MPDEEAGTRTTLPVRDVMVAVHHEHLNCREKSLQVSVTILPHTFATALLGIQPTADGQEWVAFKKCVEKLGRYLHSETESPLRI